MKKYLFLCIVVLFALSKATQAQVLRNPHILSGGETVTFPNRQDATNLTISGPGRAHFGVLNVTGTFHIGNFPSPPPGSAFEPHQTVVSVHGAEMIQANANLGNVTINPVSWIEIRGNTRLVGDETVIGTLADRWQFRHVVNKSTFTRWGVDRDGRIRSFGVSDRVFANDNYLAAAMIHQRNTGLNAVRSHLISGSSRASRQHVYLGQSGCACVLPCTPAHGRGVTQNRRGAWFNYVGRDSQYRSSYTGYDWFLSTNGMQLGTDIVRTRVGQFGMLFGYEDSRGNNQAGWNRAGARVNDHITAKDHYIGLYGVRVLRGGADLRTVLNLGWQNFTSERHGHDDNVYRAAFSGNTAEVNIEFGKRQYMHDRGSIISIRPAMALDWYLVQLHGGTETPRTEDAIRYGSTNFSQLFLRFGMDARYERGRGALEGSLFYSYDLRGSELWARASSVNSGHLHEYTNLYSSVVSSDLGRSALSFNIGGSYLLTRNLTVFGGYRGEVIPGQEGRGYIGTGYAGGAWRW